MIQINLLPVREIRRRNKAKKELMLAILTVGLFIAALAFVGIVQVIQTRGLRAELEVVQEEKEKYNDELNKIKQLEQQQALLETRIAIIKELKKNAGVAVHVMDDVASHTPPDRMWLTQLSQSSSGLEVTGMSQDNQTIARYMDELENSPYLSNVTLGKSDMKKYADRDLKEFTLRSSIDRLGPTQPAAAPAKAQ
ncbi:hypothetical protein CAY53_12060 [Desulfobulbus oralis]|uniref:Pilus assembly protein PilN n=2 Tax=Desulfobulbus oralis TaxID=1986146 RepID=A0A2L1GR15_9BACT|nr:hypothetical protein CAY53_12060 [Desulfobulbus oralis]